MKKLIILAVIVICVLCVIFGKEAVTEVTTDVLEAAKEEITQRIQETLDEYKVEVVETKPVVGKLNDEGGKYQFFCAVLVRTNAESSAQDCANALGKLFGDAGYTAQAGSKVENEYLVHKEITYKTEDYGEGNYYTVYVYTADLTKIIDLDALKAKLENK